MFVRKNLFTRLVKDRKGIAAVEYAILIGFVGVALITALTTFSTDIENVFKNTTKKFGDLAAAAPASGG